MAQSDDLDGLIRRLTPFEVFDYYDGPRFYSCRDIDGQTYLVYWVDETESLTSWLYARVSLERYSALKLGSISISDALSKTEDGFVLLVQSSSEGITIDRLRLEQIKPEWLPDSRERLSLENDSLLLKSEPTTDLNSQYLTPIATEQLPSAYIGPSLGPLSGQLTAATDLASKIQEPVTTEQLPRTYAGSLPGNEMAPLPPKLISAIDLASQARRQVFDLAFEKTVNVYEMGAGKLGRLLDAIQNTVYALSCSPTLDIRRVPEEIKQKSEVLVTGLFASSFGIRMQTKGGDLFESGDTERALQTLSELMANLNAPDVLANDLHRLNILARSRFKHLLRVMVDSQVAIKADWGSPFGQNRQAQASFSDIALSLQKLEASDAATSRVVDRVVKLVGVDVQSDFFAVVLDDGDIVKGKLARGLTTRHFAVPSFIKAKLEETSVVDPLTDREKWTYTLLDLSNV